MSAETPARRRWQGEAARQSRRHTLPEALARHARERPDAVAFTFLTDGETVADELTFAELDRRARVIAGHLRRHEAQRAVLIYPSSAEFVAALFGCLYAGVVAVHAPLVASTPERTISRLEVVAADADATFVLTTAEAATDRRRFVAPDSPLNALPWLASDTLTDPTPRDRPLAEQRLDRLALIQFTSGTTGRARGTPLRHSHLTLQSSALQCTSGSDHDAVAVGWTPLFHDMGLFLTVFAPVFAGYRSVVLFPLAFLGRPRRWLEAITRYGGTISGGPNFAYDLLARDPDPGGLDLSSWRVAFVGGEQVRPTTLARFAAAYAAAGFDERAFDPAYGLAEATCAVSGRAGFIGAGVRAFDPQELRRGRAVETPTGGQQLASVGFPHGDQECLIVDPRARTRLPDGAMGELWIRGPGVAEGYWNDQEATAAAFGAHLETGEGPFLRTGDLAFKLADELFVAGRMKELIIVRGRNVYPQDVEATVQASHPALRPGCGAAFALDGPDTELLIIAQELRADAQDDPAAIKAAIHEAVRRDHAVEPHAIVLLPPRSVPKTTSGKIQRRLCRIRYVDGVWPLGR